MVRVGVVLVANAVNQGHIPRVHAEVVVHVGNGKFKDFIRYGLPLDIAGFLALIIFVPLFFPLTL